MKRICVFAGASEGNDPVFMEQTKELGKALAANNIELVYGGAKSGLMGAIADAVLASGGKVTGVIPTGLLDREIAHPSITRMIEVASMHERKAKMSELADGFITLPGGFGTLEEFFETISWAQIGIHTKPIALYNIADYYTPLVQLIDHAIKAGFVPEDNRELIIDEADPGQMVKVMMNKS